METIYRQAESVLIIDPPLCGSHKNDFDDFELAARFMLSTWTTRLWTFQEGFLANRLYLLLKDDIVDIEELINNLADRAKANVGLFPLCRTFIEVLRFIVPPNAHEEGRKELDDILVFRTSVRNRKLTVAADETLCLSTCFGLAQGEIVATKPAERMAIFWRALQASGKFIPCSAIFFYYHRMSLPGYKWSPISILDVPEYHHRPAEEGHHASLEPAGLVVKYPGYTLRSSGEWSGVDRLKCRDANGKWYWVFHDVYGDETKQFRLPFFKPGCSSMAMISTSIARPRDERPQLPSGGLMAMLTGSKVEESAEDEQSELSHTCLLGSITESKDGVHHFEPHVTCALLYMPKRESMKWEQTYRLLEVMKDVIGFGEQYSVDDILRIRPQDPDSWPLMGSEDEFKRRAAILLSGPSFEIEQSDPDNQLWCVG